MLLAINTFSVGIEINDVTIVNVYKPPSAEFQQSVLPRFENPSIVLGDFNSHHTLWGYDDIDQDGTNLVDWMTREDYALLHSATDPGTYSNIFAGFMFSIEGCKWTYNTSDSPNLERVSKQPAPTDNNQC